MGGKASSAEAGGVHLMTAGLKTTLVEHAAGNLRMLNMMAAELLAEEGLDARVIDCHTVKPLDEAAILRAARETGAVVTAESNVKMGGLGGAVAELLGENRPTPLKRIGMIDVPQGLQDMAAFLGKLILHVHEPPPAVGYAVSNDRFQLAGQIA
mgnify:CR=1 FL=1